MMIAEQTVTLIISIIKTLTVVKNTLESSLALEYLAISGILACWRVRSRMPKYLKFESFSLEVMSEKRNKDNVKWENEAGEASEIVSSSGDAASGGDG